MRPETFEIYWWQGTAGNWRFFAETDIEFLAKETAEWLAKSLMCEVGIFRVSRSQVLEREVKFDGSTKIMWVEPLDPKTVPIHRSDSYPLADRIDDHG